MSPELIVRVPDRKEASFRRAMFRVGGIEIIERLPSPEERETREAFESLMESLSQAKPKDIQDRINFNYHRLIYDSADWARDGKIILSQPVGTRKLKKIMSGFFQDNRMGHRRAKALILRYGFVDGEFKTYQKTATLMGLSTAGSVASLVDRGKWIVHVKLSELHLLQNR